MHYEPVVDERANVEVHRVVPTLLGERDRPRVPRDEDEPQVGSNVQFQTGTPVRKIPVY